MKKRRGSSIWLFTIAVVCTVFIIPTKIQTATKDFLLTNTSPLTTKTVKVGKKISSYFSVIVHINDLQKENTILSKSLIEAKVESSKMSELTKENSDLRQQLNYKNANPNLKLILSDVIGLDPTNFSDTLLINKGSEDGVGKGMAVISTGTLVGKVDEVKSTTSKVILITSKDSIVQVMLQDSRTTGILRGGISGMVLENIPLDTKISGNENIITSGLGGNLPKGIFVGNAGSEISVKSDIFKTIAIKSPVDFRKIEHLFVISGI